MKKAIFHLLSLCLLISSCAQPNSERSKKETTDKPVSFPERAGAMNIYEVNIRQYTPKGTIKAFIPHLDRLKKMGVDILWLMPVQPIGIKNRKGPLGSPYSIKDYRAINPDYGTKEDFNALVSEAHNRDMLVILDWVANHTSWDHDWINTYVDYHTRDSVGNPMPPVPDWSDVAELNYDNLEMQDAMIADMEYWISQHDLDGFRCDVAGEVPMTFWNKAKAHLNKTKDLFMLAEWDEPYLHDSAFHMTYMWGFHHVLNEVAKGTNNADSVHTFLKNDLEKYGKKAFRMNFTTNHDENSWNGTVYERMGDGALALSVLTSTVRGMPLIYSGQEAGLNKRLSFFDKDSIDWSDIKLEAFYTKLFALKKNNPALWNGAYGGALERVIEHPQVYAYSRKTSNNEVLVMINLSDQNQKINLSDSGLAKEYTEYFSGKTYDLSGAQDLSLAPWEYLVFSNN